MTALLTMPMAATAVAVIGCALALAWVCEHPHHQSVWAFIGTWYPRVIMPTLILLCWWAIR